MKPLARFAKRYAWLMLPALLLNASPLRAQEKIIRHQNLVWVSVNSQFRLSEHWRVLADAHVRRSHFVTDPDFYLLRLAGGYQFNGRFSLAAGYAHMWLGSAAAGGWLYGHENRVYQQAQYMFHAGSWQWTQRIRQEQRWMQKIIDGHKTGQYRYTNRFRYLLALNLSLSNNPRYPALMLCNEILLNFGRQVAANHFDQNRLTVGIKQKLSPAWSMDAGYMRIVQEKADGLHYDHDNVVRLFFYYNGKWKK